MLFFTVTMISWEISIRCFYIYFYRFLQVKPLNVERLMMDASLLLPVTATPLTGIEFSKRLACGEVEHTQRVRTCDNDYYFAVEKDLIWLGTPGQAGCLS